MAVEPVTPFLVETVELGWITQRPRRPDHLVERAAGCLELHLQVRDALPSVIADRAHDDLAGRRIDRAHRRDVDHPAGLYRLAQLEHLPYVVPGALGRPASLALR